MLFNSLCVSSSIANFNHKLRKKHVNLRSWSILFPFGRCIFYGSYHYWDYLKVLLHRGKRTIFWCGSDILNLAISPFGQWVMTHVKADHVCENAIEQVTLSRMGIQARIQPALFDSEALRLPVSYQQSDTPHVFLTSHPNSDAYGVGIVESIYQKVPEVTFHIYGISGHSHDNVVYHGWVPSKVFDFEIARYQAALRLNDFDGFSESLAKSVLMGQWPISKIFYPHIDYAPNNEILISLLKDLKNKTEDNLDGRIYWTNELSKKI